MRNYWLRIAVIAFAIFGVGMLIWSGIRRGSEHVKEVVHSSEPITVPLAFVPFNVDGKPLGTLRRVRLVRSAPDRVQAIEFRVKLADSVADSRFADCVLVAGGTLENVDKEQMFACVPAADTVGKALEQIGEVETQRGTTITLLGEPGTLESIHLDFAEHAADDSLSDAAMAQAESLVAAQGALSDSIEAKVDSAFREMEPRMKARMKEAMQRAKEAEARARKAQAAAEAGPPAPPTAPRAPTP